MGDVVTQNGGVDEDTTPIDEVVEELEPEASPFAEADGYEFDFSLIHATDVKAYRIARTSNKTVECFAALLPALVNLEQPWATPGEAPYKLILQVVKAFAKASLTYVVEPVADIRFKVEEIQGQEVENWQVWAVTCNVVKQAELMEKYISARHKNFPDLLELEYKTFLSVCSKFTDALLDLGKN